MKKSIAALFLALFVSAGVFAGNVKEASVPVMVKEYITKNYPQVSPVEWNYEKKGNYYNAQFKINGSDYNLDISPKGELINSEMQIAATEIPTKINAYIGQQFPGFKVKDAWKKTHMGVTTYQIDINGQNTDQTLYFSEDGTLIKKKL